MRHILLSAVTLLASALCACASDNEPTLNEGNKDNKVLIVYFSCTGTTEGIAEKINKAAGGEILRIEAEEAYTSADLNYNTDCRANREQNDPAARPAIKTQLPNMANYDVVFLGYPIWWGKAPKIIYTLLESADFNGKTIIPFCTSGSSGIAGSEPALHELVPDATWLSGRRFASSTSQSTINEWVETIMKEASIAYVTIDIPQNTVYYDLQGRLANESSKGILIARNGNKSTVVLKR